MEAYREHWEVPSKDATRILRLPGEDPDLVNSKVTPGCSKAQKAVSSHNPKTISSQASEYLRSLIDKRE